MTGLRTGVQQRIKETNPPAEFVPCNNHNLNLLGVNTASASVSAVTFFGTVQRCFYFFAASTHRWDVLKSNCSVPVKRAVDARWSARKEAVSCLKKVFSRVVDTHEIWQIRKKHETREEAGLLLSALQTFLFLFPLYVGAHTVERGHYAKILKANKIIWTLFSVLQRFGIWMTFCRDKENHWLPMQWPKQLTFVKRWESPLNGEFAEEEECLVKRLMMLVSH